jgi:TonB-dependent starch-binding outer membrane protein SusC
LNTGANLQVKGEDLQRLSTTNALQALQGQAPGVQITSTSGQPGSGMRVVIRGQGTNFGAGPLYVVDGVLTGDINYLNPNDIETITVLKDAASAAIYGSQSANGVILVTTKSGKEGAAQITFDAFYGIQNVARKVDMLNSKEYASIMNEAAVNSGKLPYFTNDEIAAMGEGTDWMDEMFVKDAATQSYTLGASGGSDKSTYSLSIGYLEQEGIVGGKDFSNYQRYNFRINSEHKLYKDLVTIGQNLNFAYTENNGVGVGNQYNNTLRGAFNTSPFVPMYDEEGNFWDNSESDWNNGEANPYASMVYNNQNKNASQKLIGNLYLQVEPIKNLKFRTSLGLDYYSNDGHSFTPEYKLSIYSFNDFSKVNQNLGKGTTWLWDNLLSYSIEADLHHIEVMAGTSAVKYTDNNLNVGNGDMVFNNLEQAWINTANNTSDAVRITLSGGPDDNNIENRLSYFGRLNYDFNEKYLFNATFRADGSSKFSPENRWGYFPSVSAGWVITNEDFMANATDFVSSFKLRASWGQVGNQRVKGFQYLAPVKFDDTNYIFGPDEGVLTSGAFLNRLKNEGLGWETSEQTNVGFDAKFMSGRLNVNFDWYDKTTKDLIVKAPILAIAGAEAPFINGGNIKNTGVELALAYTSNAGDFHYSVGVNGAYNKNEVSSIATSDEIIHGLTNQLYDNSLEFYRMQNGYPIGYFWGLQTDGLFQTEEDVANHRSSEGQILQPSAKPGDVRFKDRNDDGVLDDQDRTMIGNPNPDYTFGFSLNASYKGFDFLVLANGVAGNEIVQSYRNQSAPFGNYTSAILDRWHGPGSSNSIPRVTENNSNWTSFSDLYIHKGDFLRISNVTLGYDFMRLMKTKFVKQFRVYTSALNLFTFTKYEGMDPEIGYGVDNTRDHDAAFSSGIDLGYYPRQRTYMVGVNIKF